MKKAIALLTTVVCLLAVFFCFSACGSKEPKIEGKYYLQSLMHDDTAGGLPMTSVTIDVVNPEYIVGGEMDFSQFYIEFKDGKMIWHGGWEVTAGPNYKFYLNPDMVAEYSYEIKEAEQKGWYDIYLDGTGGTEPFGSFRPGNKYSSACVFRQYTYGLETGTEQITCTYYLEGSPEVSK